MTSSWKGLCRSNWGHPAPVTSPLPHPLGWNPALEDRAALACFRADTRYWCQRADLQRLPPAPASHRRLSPSQHACRLQRVPARLVRRPPVRQQWGRVWHWRASSTGPGTDDHGCLANGSFCLKYTRRRASAPTCPSSEVALGPCLPTYVLVSLQGSKQL